MAPFKPRWKSTAPSRRTQRRSSLNMNLLSVRLYKPSYQKAARILAPSKHRRGRWDNPSSFFLTLTPIATVLCVELHIRGYTIHRPGYMSPELTRPRHSTCGSTSSTKACVLNFGCMANNFTSAVTQRERARESERDRQRDRQTDRETENEKENERQ